MAGRFGSSLQQANPVAERLVHHDMLVSNKGDILSGGIKGKRLVRPPRQSADRSRRVASIDSPRCPQALRFDAVGNCTYEEISRMEVLKMIQSAATGMPEMTQDTTPTFSRSRSRTRFVRDTPVEIPAIHMRDLRKLDNVFSASNEPSITVRQQAILVNCDPIRAVIMRNVMMVFLPDGADSLIQYLKTGMKEHLAEASTFEFAAVEAILATICRIFSLECEKIIPRCRVSLDKMAKDDSMLSELENLRAVKNEMSALESQVAGMRRMLMSLLENEEDMHMLYLTKLFNEPQYVHDLFGFDSEEAESFLEVYLQEIYGTQSRVSLMTNNIQNTESIVMLKLDSKRNFLLSIDLSLTLMGTLIAVPTFIVGGFGMNLNSYIQQTEGVFWSVFAFCVLFIVIGYVYFVNYLKKQGINMSWKY
ncbi:Aste57867_1564 [Aphanomyces stellatus]|uniref:Magnesium transporter n=1 Tax=Aphanomyces stellatus TaxID=120398 RepID=A0A485K5Y9_9STRA|nr:hypothetical protein As57867_001563 [Aphanomyces stellatus]VFT78777.1 Aste57867_1564 [Aphanomyces stellatus]